MSGSNDRRTGSGAFEIPAALTGPAAAVDARLARLMADEQERWSRVDTEAADLVATLGRVVLGGGKRLRPAFCHWAFVGAGGDPTDRAVADAGAALEMLHAAALLHDDVIDRSDRRHGAETVHIDYARRHARGGWRGEAGHFGESVAILLGDLALGYAGRLLAGAPAAAIDVFDEVRLEVNIGQYLDVLGGAHADPDPARAGSESTESSDDPAAGEDRSVTRARRICLYKTAKYTVERPLQLGATLTGTAAGADLAAELSRVGLPLGEAFQLRDDLLGVFGDPAVTGKPVGDDLREGKPTLLATLAAATARSQGSTLLDRRLGVPDLTESEVEAMQDLIVSTGARDRVEASIAELLAAALAVLTAIPIRTEARHALEELAVFVVDRDR